MSSQGNLVVHVFTSGAVIPIEDATIVVTKKISNNLVELFAIRLTDESGTIKLLTIPTPNLEASQLPYQERPFSLMNVTVEHPLYERIIVEDVQIFPDTVSMQNLQLIPLDEVPKLWNKTEIFQIPSQDL